MVVHVGRASGGAAVAEEQKRIRREKESAPAEEIEDVAADTREQLKEDVDEILDEIDAVLEENAEEFVRSYIQKGGE